MLASFLITSPKFWSKMKARPFVYQRLVKDVPQVCKGCSQGYLPPLSFLDRCLRRVRITEVAYACFVPHALLESSFQIST